MYNADAQKKYMKNNNKRIPLNYKTSDYNIIEQIAIDNNIPVSTLCKCYIKYCIDNNIDIQSYIK